MRKSIAIISLQLLLIVFAPTIMSQNVNVNPGAGSYPTLKAAFDAINSGVHTGAVTVSILGNTTETQTAILNASGVGNASYSNLTITPSGGSRTITGNDTVTIRFSGADNVTIDGRIGGSGRNLTILNTSTLSNATAVWLSHGGFSTSDSLGARNNTVRNCEISCGVAVSSSTTTTIGILVSGTSKTASGRNNDNNRLLENNIVKCRIGIYVLGTSINTNENNLISANVIGPASNGNENIGANGIFVRYQDLCSITNNEVRFVGGTLSNTTSSADRIGIAVGINSWTSTANSANYGGNNVITNNVIHDIVEERSGSAVGILISSTLSGPKTNNLIANNVIYNLKSNGSSSDQCIGIGSFSGPGDRFIFNSISIIGDMDPDGVSSALCSPIVAGISKHASSTDTAVLIANNSILIDANSNTLSLLKTPIIAPDLGYNFGSGGMKNNNYYVPSLQNGNVTGVSGTSTLSYSTLQQWQIAFPGQDLNSMQLDPKYTNNSSNLKPLLGSPLKNSGAPISAVTSDIEGIARNATNPTIGAYETTTPNCNISWKQVLRLRDAGSVNDSITFGMSPAGTNGLDTCLGEVLVPPPPPIGVFDCRFILPTNDAVKTDFRKDTVQNINWRMTFQPSVSGYPVTFTWNNQTLPSTGTFFLKDEITGTIVNVNMRNVTSYTLTNSGITSLKIEYLYNQTLSGSVSPGWNIVSVPLRTTDMLYTALFPGVASEAYTYSGGYVSISMLSNGTGYWMRFNNNANYNFTGYPWSPENMIVSAGWNLIGPFDENIPVNTILSNPAGIVSSGYFGYTGGYYNPDTLKVGKGYWIRTTMAGYLYKGATDNQPATAENPLEKFVKLSLSGGEEISASLYLGNAEEINSDYSLPPVPPQGIFDARFGTDKMVEVLGRNHQIRITPSQNEIVLSVDNAKGMKFRVKDEIDGTILNKELTEESPVIVPANLSTIMLEMIDALPLTYELSQNYPNPFNPATVINYQVPNDGVVKITVYDVLGREVKQLVNGFRSAGRYETRFDAGSLSSGVYFYRMNAGSFDVIKKMMVVK
ncbi:MAG: T9SS type A sorting domain-containing protein [Ignavibacteria bacterium]|nr:T9SS type A sorting domain-containing protein [Ignavibacteria bacterium]